MEYYQIQWYGECKINGGKGWGPVELDDGRQKILDEAEAVKEFADTKRYDWPAGGLRLVKITEVLTVLDSNEA